MGTVRGLSIRLKLTVPVAILAAFLLVTLGWQIFRTYAPQAAKASAYDQANSMADFILGAAAEQAKERGFTVAYLSALKAGRLDTALLGSIKKVRNAGDGQMKRALTIGHDLEAKGWAGQAFHAKLAATEDAYTAVKKLRDSVDRAKPREGKPKAPEWFASMTHLIEVAEDLRGQAFFPATRLERVAFTNREIKTAIWLASEYAGRERAMFAGAAANRKPLTADQLATLNDYRGIVDRQLAFLKSSLPALVAATSSEQLSAELQKSRQRMESQFLGDFESLRQSMYAAAKTGDYPVGKSQWLQHSTAAINSILDLTKVASGAARQDAARVQSTANSSFWMAGTVSFLGMVLGAAVLFLVVRTTGRIRNAEQRISSVAGNNDLTLRMDASGGDELSRMATAFNGMLVRFQEIISAVNEAVSDVAASVAQVSASSEQTDRGVAEQRSAIDQVATAMNEMAATVQEVARSAAQAASAADESDQQSKLGEKTVGETADSIQALADQVGEAARTIRELDEEGQAISKVIDVINGLSEQTNLLALNAAIEAARAGAHGRGFAVVADEVRTLAQQTRQSTDEIREIIGRLQERTSASVLVMEQGQEMTRASVDHTSKAASALNGIVSSVGTISEMNGQIATAAEEQASVAEEIDRNIANIVSVAEQSASAAAETVNAAGRITDQMEQLKQRVSVFRVAASA